MAPHKKKSYIRQNKLIPTNENPQINLSVIMPSNPLLRHFRSISVKFCKGGGINLNSAFSLVYIYLSFDDFWLSQHCVLLSWLPPSQPVTVPTYLFFCLSEISPHPFLFLFILTIPIKKYCTFSSKVD